MATIDKRQGRYGRTVYRVRIRQRGLHTATFKTLAEAKKWASVTEAAILEGRYFPSTHAKRHTGTDLLTRYRHNVFPHKRPSTVRTQTHQLEWWCQHVGSYPLAEVTPAVVVEYRDVLIRTRSNATAARYLAVLSHAFTTGVKEWQWVHENPVQKVRKPKEPRGRVRFLSDDERIRLLAACQHSRNPHLYGIVMVALSTGARRGELLNLTWSDVDLERGFLTFHATKNGESRSVPLTGAALDLMRHHARVRRLDMAFVFPNPTGEQPSSIRTAFERAVIRAGIPNFHFHDLRHSAAAYFVMNGASLLELADILGHKTLAMVKRYAHFSVAHTRSVVERMNRAIFGER